MNLTGMTRHHLCLSFIFLLMVGGDGFEPPNPKEQIYSLPRLTSSLSLQMVGKTGFEPATPWSQTKCSTKLSHFPINNTPAEDLHPLLVPYTPYPSIARQCAYRPMFSFLIFKLCTSHNWWSEVELNHRHQDFQSCALPTELSDHTS